MIGQTLIAGGVSTITPSDTGEISVSSLYVGTGGDVKVRAADGSIATFAAVPSGMLLPVLVTRVYATGTTASNITGLL